jgi:hypothetical protein
MQSVVGGQKAQGKGRVCSGALALEMWPLQAQGSSDWPPWLNPSVGAGMGWNHRGQPPF